MWPATPICWRLQGSWDLYIKALKQYKEREGDCLVPCRYVEMVDGVKVSLGNWCNNIRNAKREKGSLQLTIEMIAQLEKLDFIWDFEKTFDKFYRMALVYKEKYGYTNIKVNDCIDGYLIGEAYNTIYKQYKDNKLKDYQIEQLKSIGIDITINRYENNFKNRIQLARKAVNEGVVINNSNRCYMGTNFYTWITKTVRKKYLSNELTTDEIYVIERLINKPIYRMFNNDGKNDGKFIKVIDIIRNCTIGIYCSQKNVIKVIREKFNLNINKKDIYIRIYEKTTFPYKGRFMFYYATDEETKKYLEDSKIS